MQLRGVAQLGSALRSGRRGRRFKSCHPDQQNAWSDTYSDSELEPASFQVQQQSTAASSTRPQMRGPTSHTQDAAHSVQGTSGSARTNNPNGVPAGRPRPADSTPQSSNRGAQNMRLHSARWQDRHQHAAESGVFQIKAPRERGAAGAACPPPCGPCAGLLWTGRRHAGAPSGGCSSTRGLYSTSWMRPSKVRCSIISRATSG